MQEVTIIYEIFTRNYSEAGDFKAIEQDLSRIKELGVDVIWLMPFYPIGETGRKGTAGSPYAISDYRSICSTHGTFDDFKSLVSAAHKQGLKIMIDIVFNHVAHDSVIVKDHPEWILKDAYGDFARKEPDWSDVFDLDFYKHELRKYLVETLRFWVDKGVDGFRCDVAPMVPLSFWDEARKELDNINPELIWLAESAEAEFVKLYRDREIPFYSSLELHPAFDLSYDYDFYAVLIKALKGEESFSTAAFCFKLEQGLYPAGHTKLRFLENHDQLRIAEIINNDKALKSWTAFLFMLPGATLLFNGQEYGAKHYPALFEKDQITALSLKDKEVSFFSYVKKLIEIKKEHFNGIFDLEFKNDLFILSYDKGRVFGVFNTSKELRTVKLSDEYAGIYQSLLDEQEVDLSSKELKISNVPLLLKKQ